MANRWTDEQLQAINVEGCNVIVSAGAGSGKTAVLTQRVLRKIKSNIPINKLLILTFTKAAAKEMKDRIRRALKKEGFNEQLKLLDSAYITTFDSFSLSVVKKYHINLGINKDIKVTDAALINIRKKEILDSIFDKKYQESSERFQKLIEHFALKDDKELKEMILSISNKLDLRYDKFEYLHNYDNLYYSANAISSSVDDYLSLIKKDLSILRELVQEISEHLDSKDLEKIYLKTDSILNSKNYDEIKNSLLDCKLPPKNNNYDEEAVILKESIKSVLDDLKALCNYTDIEEMKKDLLATKSDTLEVLDIILKLQTIFKEVKEKEQLYDFNDISHLAIKLVLEHPDVREEIKNSFQEILIDEYQDTSDTQEMFISQISNNNVYMVGDIKQSIYRFRNANPYIFKEKYDSYNQDPTKGRKIDLNKNFRSRFEVLDNINLLFSYIMDDEIGGADYKKEHKMVFGNTTYINEGKTEQNYNMVLKTYEAGDDFKNIVKEAFIIGNDIKNKIDNHYQIFDKDEKILKDASYNDFAILLDVKKNFDLYKQIFEYLDIPLTLYRDEDLTASTDLNIIRNLLKLVLLVHDDTYDTEFKYVYTSIARSFLFNIDDAYIFDTFKDNSFRSSDIVKKALTLKDKIDILPLETIFYDILNEYNYEEKVLLTTNIMEKEKRIEYLANLVRDLSSKDYNIYDFVYYLDQVIEDGYSIKYKINQDTCNSVKIMSIHASKGLEFPICYFANLENKFNQMALREKISYDNELGILLPVVTSEVIPTIRTKLYKTKIKKEDISEKIRLFYVALTRCKEEIIIVAKEDEETSLTTDIVPNLVREKYTSFSSIIKSINSILNPYIEKCVDVDYTKDYLLSIQSKKLDVSNADTLQITERHFICDTKQEKNFSKNTIHLLTSDEEKELEFGTKVHMILEQLDFKNPNLDHLNISSYIKKKIEKFLDQNLIKNNLNSKIIKEYEFMDTTNDIDSHGIIDLLIENDEEVIIIDYKLNNIVDDAYKKQLLGYKDMIKKKTAKPIKTYLYSIIQEEFKEIKDSD